MSLINYRSTRAMMEMFDLLYKMGVEHAHNAYSNEEITEFLEATSSPSKYGLLSDGSLFEWQRWRSFLFFWVLNLKGVQLEGVNTILDEAYNLKSVASCFYPISFSFYTQGIIDRLETPISQGVYALFRNARKVRLAEFAKKGVRCKSMTERNYTALVQGYAYALADEESSCEVGGRIGSTRYTKFAEMFWRVIAAHRGEMRARYLDRKLKLAKDEELRERILIDREGKLD